MKHAFKTALTLLAALTLLFAQGGFVLPTAAAPAKKMGCCGDRCPTHCCVGKSDSAPAQPLPAIPTVSLSQSLQAALLPAIVCLIALEPPVPLPSSFGSSVSSVGSSVPLYVRTHSFLI